MVSRWFRDARCITGRCSADDEWQPRVFDALDELFADLDCSGRLGDIGAGVENQSGKVWARACSEGSVGSGG